MKAKSKLKKDFIESLAQSRAKVLDKEIIDEIYNICIERVKLVNSTGKTSCIFIVPVFLYGKPLFNVSEVSSEIVKKLTRLKLKVSFKPPNILSITWI